MTKQIIFGDDVSSATAFGIRCVNQAGTLLTTAPASGLFRFERLNAGGTVSEVKSPWIDVADVIGTSVTTGAAATPQVMTTTLTEDAVTPDVAFLKIIDVGTGYEPFNRLTIEIPAATVGGAANSMAAYVLAQLPANKLPNWISTVAAPGAGVLNITGTTYQDSQGGTATSKLVMAFETASAATAAVPTYAGGSVGVGDVEVMKTMEKNNVGSGVSEYDRATYLLDGTELYASAGFPYQLSTITWKDSKPNQINGVDNERILILAVRNSAAAVAPATGTEPGTIVGGL